MGFFYFVFTDTIRDDLLVAYEMARRLYSISNYVDLTENNPPQLEMINQWIQLVINNLSNPNKFVLSMQEFDSALNSCRFLVGNMLSFVDIAGWAELKSFLKFFNSL